jgi:hypothetical protein
MNPISLTHISEPTLKFGYGQKALDPRDGLTLFGPIDKGKVNNFSVGIIGPPDGIKRMRNWLQEINSPVFSKEEDIARPFFPGFETAFGVTLNQNSIVELEVQNEQLEVFYRYQDNFLRVGEIVDLYCSQLIQFKNEDERNIDLWFVVVPDELYALCKIQSHGLKDRPIKTTISAYDRANQGLFEDENRDRLKDFYKYENHFHNQLKVRLLKEKILTQIIRESTVAYREFLKKDGKPKRDLEKFESAITWNICTSIYYKIGGLPWKLGSIRDKVCYLGLVFKRDERNKDERFACCAAQMFLDSGDGLVFKGSVGPWYNAKSKEFHITKAAAKDMLTKAINAFKVEHKKMPEEIFIHGKTYFDNEEWAGFMEAVGGKINLVGIRITHEPYFKLFREFVYPVPRGTAYIVDGCNAFLWTKGFIPRIQSVMGLETPNPLSVKIIRGKADMQVVCRDVLSLTKLNYNTCIFGDGVPITLKFADVIGEILTAGPTEGLPVLPFKYYI